MTEPDTVCTVSKPYGWFKAVRGLDALELIRLNPNAFTLAYIIASRARYSAGFNADGLNLGEAMIGDYQEHGMTRQQYRTALRHLDKHGFATSRSTNRGTIAKLTDTRLFDPLSLAGNQPLNQQATIKQPTANHQATTNKKDKKENKVNNERSSAQEGTKCSIGIMETKDL